MKPFAALGIAVAPIGTSAGVHGAPAFSGERSVRVRGGCGCGRGIGRRGLARAEGWRGWRAWGAVV